MILSINAGSTSFKYGLFTNGLKPVDRGKFFDTSIHKEVFVQMLNNIRNISDADIRADSTLKIVHRVVHGGPTLRDPIKINRDVIKEIRRWNKYAPLHNPYNLHGITLSQAFFKTDRHYAVFDTGFFKHLPDVAKFYPVSMSAAQKKGYMRLGFHGISHEYALLSVQKKSRKKVLNLIIIHLGGGCSITAVQKNKPIDTSMGFTPYEGTMMWSRTGDIDAGPLILSHIKHKEWRKIFIDEAGVKAVSQKSNFLEVLEGYKKKHKKSQFAVHMFVYRIQKYIGAYYAVLGGHVDALVFTGQIGAGFALTRTLILKKMTFLKRTNIIVVNPDEEYMMAHHVHAL